MPTRLAKCAYPQITGLWAIHWHVVFAGYLALWFRSLGPREELSEAYHSVARLFAWLDDPVDPQTATVVEVDLLAAEEAGSDLRRDDTAEENDNREDMILEFD
ncbi:hypothetical protein CERZMDRAFT_88098 [Cercospora zeae-maydis SCOH1-5]|uniref:Uncharacterized protein n=1 Tax=Cercospora zeae-maydis SCOH1-5 TaxID=717836 RepID=A0A6A6F2R1_9PEZI|nr:hypothetical protein CERZMDRAFT_88098 [Cercospora zeae-maydis SCOH1-5]